MPRAVEAIVLGLREKTWPILMFVSQKHPKKYSPTHSQKKVMTLSCVTSAGRPGVGVARFAPIAVTGRWRLPPGQLKARSELPDNSMPVIALRWVQVKICVAKEATLVFGARIPRSEPHHVGVPDITGFSIAGKFDELDPKKLLIYPYDSWRRSFDREILLDEIVVDFEGAAGRSKTSPRR